MHTECYPVSILPRLSRLFLDYAESREPLAPFYPESPYAQAWMADLPTKDAKLRAQVADLLTEGGGSGRATSTVDRRTAVAV